MTNRCPFEFGRKVTVNAASGKGCSRRWVDTGQMSTILKYFHIQENLSIGQTPYFYRGISLEGRKLVMLGI
jgi:hypothetical protein